MGSRDTHSRCSCDFILHIFMSLRIIKELL
jgi:hypothetical protein